MDTIQKSSKELYCIVPVVALDSYHVLDSILNELRYLHDIHRACYALAIGSHAKRRTRHENERDGAS